MSFQKRLTSGEFVVLAEMNTPKGVDISELIVNARRIKGRVDAVVIPDMNYGIMRLSALAGGVLMHQQGIESIIHVYGRDRNQMALQGDLLAAHVLGIQNLIVMQGEAMPNGDHRDAKTVDDLDENGLLNAIRTLQNGTDLAGFELSGTPSFVTGATVDSFCTPEEMDMQIEKARQKVDAGAQFIIAPAIFDLEFLAQFIEKAKSLNVPVIATVFLIKSVGIARYMNLNEPSAKVSEALIRRIKKASDREVECLRIAAEMITELQKLAQGVLIVTSGWEYQLPTILDYARF